MNPRSSGWRFGLVTLAAVLAVGGTVSLGRWQLSRAAEKEAVQARIEAQRGRVPLDAAALRDSVPPTGRNDHATPGTAQARQFTLLDRPIVLQGRWLGDHTVFLDNRQMNGKVGFDVLTPLQLDGQAGVVLVQRGWAPRNFLDRSALPPVDTPMGRVTLQGRIASAPARLYALGGADEGVVRQNLDLDRFRAETRLPLLDVTVVQTGPASEGLLRQWPAPASGVGRHYGYAFQWFALSAVVATLYVWFQIVRRLFPFSQA